jgi:hypothetical protein
LDREPLAEELSLLILCINVVCPVLGEVVELVEVVVDEVVPLLQVEELRQLVVHEAH